MKKTLLLPILLLLLATIAQLPKAGAQITGITLIDFDFMASSGCLLPAADSTTVYGNITGTPGPTDSVSLHIYFGDGTDTMFKTNITVSGGYYSYYSAVMHYYYLPGSYTSHATALAPGVAMVSATSPYTNSIADTCAALSGKMYLNLNGNCVPDAGEPGLTNLPLYVVNTVTGDTTFGAWTDTGGNYSINLVPGSYVILSNYGLSGGNIAPSCPSAGTYSITITTGGTYTENFAYHCITPTTLDMSAWLACTHFKAGHVADMWLETNDWNWFSQVSCTTLSATATLTIDSRLSYVYSSIPAPTSVVGNVLTWNFSTVSELWGLYTGIEVYCPSTLTLSDTICNTLTVTPTALTDPDLSNNTINFYTPVSASFDPNGISVSPAGIGAPGYIGNNTPLTYTIHFQNTGTAEASNITVDDTLSTNLDMKTLHIIKSSSPVDIYESGNVVKFKFNNINLPDTATSAFGSIGTITYGIMPKSSLAPGTQLTNTAGIYFDYNAPVMTNTALNTIESTSGTPQVAAVAVGKVTVYPNPADEQIIIKTDGRPEFTACLVDVLGKVTATSNSKNNVATINTKNLPEGFYFVKVNDQKGNETSAKVVVRH